MPPLRARGAGRERQLGLPIQRPAPRLRTRAFTGLAICAAILQLYLASLSGAQAEALTPFYRGTQVQGHLFGMGLLKIPPYVLAPDTAFPYKLNPKLKEEIPFVDAFTINRVLGGYPEPWLSRFNLLRDDLGRRSLDYVVRDADGTLKYRPELLRARLQPYLDAGYSPSDITLSLDNPPWDVKTPDQRPAEMGPYGRKTPPGDLDEWAMIIRHFASDLKAYLGAAAGEFNFESGVEFDQRKSFDGGADAFFRYYKATEDAIHAVLPGARFSPGEFTGRGTCGPEDKGCVYDSKDFMAFAQQQNLVPSFLPRSLNAFQDRGGFSPTATARRFEDSYARLPRIPEEVHQFGLLFQPFGQDAQNDPGAKQAAWEFDALAGMMARGQPQRVYHWGGFATVGQMSFLNGSGFLRLALDHYLGREYRVLRARDGAEGAETAAMTLTRGDSTAVMIASFSAKPEGGPRDVDIELPPDIHIAPDKIRIVAFKDSDNIFATIRRDLEAEDNLREEFANCTACLGNPVLMAQDAGKARRMLARDWPRYQEEMHAALRWAPAGDQASVHDRLLSVRLEANELLVVE